MDFKDLGQKIVKTFLSITDKLLDRIPDHNRRMVIYIAGGAIFLCIIVTIIAIAGHGRGARNSQAMLTSVTIPVEELFYPAEPDFLPFLLLEREPRQPWTQDDIGGFWTDPGPGYEDKWRETAEAVIDKLMEGVP